ncbi:MAG: ankyrin repeat domain-containing protein [Pseudomonadota bacterium]
MTSSLDHLRRQAKALRKAIAAGDAAARNRLQTVFPGKTEAQHADALHVIAREAGFASWPKLKFAREALSMDRAEQAMRLRTALYFGQHWVVASLLEDTPDLAGEDLGLAIALYDRDLVEAALSQDPGAATRPILDRPPLCHLAFSQHLHGGGREADMLAVARALHAAGADVNATYNHDNDPNAPLSCVYGAIGHGNNMALGRWLLEHGADPNDGESLYHATELGHHTGLQMLLDHGARPEGTNALPRALDFNDHTAVRMLLDAGADPNEGIQPHSSGEPSFVVPALHQAARRMCDGAMIDLLIDRGADPSKPYRETTPYAVARVYGNGDAAARIAAAGGDAGLSPEEALLAKAADDDLPKGAFLDPAKLPLEFRNLLRSLLHLPERLPHLKRLVAIGLEYDRPDEIGLTPVQVAGWEGLPDVMSFFLEQKPDLSHVNGYGGTLLSTIIHGSENCPARDTRDHIECARRALVEGVALPIKAIQYAGDEAMAAFLADWGEAHPGQVVDNGVY